MDYKTIFLLIEDIESTLDSLFMCGLSSAPNNISVNCNNLAGECKKYGLEFAGEKLECIAKALDKRRHNVEYNYSDVVSDFCILSCYLNVIKSKAQIKSAVK